MTELVSIIEQALEWAAIGAIGIYTLETIVMIAALHKKFPTRQFSTLPRISVVVAARNEEKNIAACLQSLVALDYPKEQLEIIVADDRSQDRTADIIKQYAAQYPFVKYLLVEESAIKGKGNAIHQAAVQATGEFILMTDADCVVKPTWAKDTLKYFTDETGLVCGITLPSASRAFERIQALNWCYLLATGSAVAAIGFPIGGIGNNFSFRRSTYFEVGGYEKVRFSVTEDFALFQAIKKTKWKIACPVEYGTQNTTVPEQTVCDLYKQQKRWVLGGLGGDRSSLATLTLGFVAHVLTILSFFLFTWRQAFLMLLWKVGMDFLFLLTPLRRLHSASLLKAMPFFALYHYCTMVLIPLLLLFDRKVVWKGRVYVRGA
ncbi:MAG: glycosyltransferase [Chloroherpetonaceae bacterium]|nr:glycosyltransferase [Chloroherpetonaceae bacterium]MCS7211482.1 glycosyltransferase [Chloroherpetonaceae bacterium]MDW8018914.1 glycosyltransferase [Chloroherpetonaceae bacterium]